MSVPVTRAPLRKYLPDLRNYLTACGGKDGFVSLSSRNINTFLKHVLGLACKTLIGLISQDACESTV